MTRDRVGSERQVLWEFLDQQFDAILWKLEGLTDEQLRQPLTPSGMCLLALAKHVAGVPYYWFFVVFGRPCEPWPGAMTDDIELDPIDTTESVLAYFARSRAAAEQAIHEADLEATGTTWLGDTVSFRWAILHTIEEAARHAGHADLMRERLDNTTGHLPAKNLPY
jgi:uncharacterized damage-inducible protein DinB